MHVKNSLRRCLAFSIIVTIVTIAAGCSREVVVIGSPYERFDHNRTQTIVMATDGAGKTVTRKVVDEVYRPLGSDHFPTAQYSEKAGEADRLPAANVVPIFTGILLPLSEVPVSGGRSDRSDLIDFLSEGPLAQTGVEPSGMSGDHKATETAYKPVLDSLGSKERLTGDRKQLIQRLSPPDLEVGDEVIDPRYRRRAFADVVALKYQQFWFILYKLPGSTYYSRLVVVPAREKPRRAQ